LQGETAVDLIYPTSTGQFAEALRRGRYASLRDVKIKGGKMQHKLKFLGFALVAALAMSAVAGSVASAGVVEVEGGGDATITGEQINGNVTGVATPVPQLKTDVGVLKCTPSTFHGLAKNGATQVSLTPTYGNTTAGTGCTIAGLAGPVIHTNGCSFLYTLQAGGPPTAVETHVVCPEGQAITMTYSATCTITFGAQTFPSSRVSVANSGGANPNMDVVATIDVVGIDYVEHGTCPNGGGNTATKTNGEYKGVVTLKGDVPGTANPRSVTIK
jgi:hypothetical protein